MAEFIENIYLNWSLNLTKNLNANFQANTTVKPLIKIAKVIIKKGRTWIWVLSIIYIVINSKTRREKYMIKICVITELPSHNQDQNVLVKDIYSEKWIAIIL